MEQIYTNVLNWKHLTTIVINEKCGQATDVNQMAKVMHASKYHTFNLLYALS